jgi:hypothetical protein
LSQDIFRQREIVKGRATAQGRQLCGRITLAHRDEQAEKLAVAASRLELEEELRSYGRAELVLAQLLVRLLGLEPIDAEAAAAALAPTVEQIERLAADPGSLFTVLSELTEAVQPVQLQHKVLAAALAKLLQALKIPDTLAVEVADALHLEPADFIPCLADPTLLPGVLHDWSNSEAFDAALSGLSKSVRKFMQELVEERLTGKRHQKLHKAALAAVQTFEMTRQHFEMIADGDVAGILKLMLVDAAAGAVDALTAGLQDRIRVQAVESAGQVEQVRAIRSESISLWIFAVAFLCGFPMPHLEAMDLSELKQKVRKRRFGALVAYKYHSFHQDRLGTNRGKALTKRARVVFL